MSVFCDKFSGRLTEVVDRGFSVDELDGARQEFVRRLERMEGSQDDS